MNHFLRMKLMNLFLAFVLSISAVMILPDNEAAANGTDEYDLLRGKLKAMLTGGTSYHAEDPDLSGIISKITAVGQSAWDGMDKSADRTFLWQDIGPNLISDNLTSNYNRIRNMAMAYSTEGSSLHKNTELKSDIIAALDWMYATGYNTTVEMPGNWWHREIGAPLALNDITILMYDDLTATQISNYMAPIAKYVPVVKDKGANRVWFSIVMAYRGVIVKDGAKIAAARDGLSQLFDYVTSGDGFYTDGSFIAHGAFAYTGGYGQDLIQDITSLMYLLSGSTWDVTDPDKKNVFKWVHDSYAPLMYKGAMMDMSRGRVISRENSEDHVIGHVVISAVTRLSQFAPSADAAAFKSMVKEWIQSDTYLSFYSNATLYTAVLAKQIMNDPNIEAAAYRTKYKQFPNMDRVSLFRPDYAFALSMHSSRIFNYESINNENLRGWHTGDGMTYLYNNDTAQYSDDYWPTVNSYRLPGTTTVKGSTVSPGQKSDQAWVGGTDLGEYGITGMSLHTINLISNADHFTVVSGGAWTVTGGQYVLTNPASGTVNGNISVYKTVVVGDYVLTVDGTATPTASDWNDFSIIFNFQDDLNYYFVSLNESNDGGTSGIFKVVNGAKTEIADISSTIAAGTKYTVKVEKTGSIIKAYLNGSLIASASDSTFTTGRIGLGTMNDGAAFDNVTVTSPTININETFDSASGSGALQSLKANKSWFMFDDEIVALGASITSAANKPVETIIENRKINGDNALTINNEAYPTTLGWSDSLYGVKWAHLKGNVAGADIGYYFPDSPQVNGLREARTDKWRSINGSESTAPVTRNYMTLWFDHGANPTDASYSYVLLPNKDSSEVSAYAQMADITILENSKEAQAVKENKLNITGVNFWKDEVKKVGFIQSDKKASVMTKETAKDIEISVSDPTHLNTGTIQIELDRSANYTISNDPSVEVIQLSPTIKLAIHTNGLKGAASKIKLSYEEFVPEVTGLALDKSEVDVYINETAALTAIVTPEHAKNKSILWSSGNPEVATVLNGIVKPLKVGSTTITATTVDGGYTSTCRVNVLERNFALSKNVVESRRSIAPGDAALLPSNAVDGRSDTRWASYRSDNEWIYVDLGKIHVINRVVLNWEFSYGKEYRIEVSNDPQAGWQPVYSTSNGRGGIENITFENVSAQYVRMYGVKRSNIYSFSLWELEVYGPENAIIGINPLDDITVSAGTAQEALELPTAVTVELNNGKSVSAAVYWDRSTLDLNVAGSYELPGTVEGTDLKAKVKINVVDTTPPEAPVILWPAKPENMKDKPSVTVYAEAGSIISILENGATVATATGAGSTAVEIPLDALTHGPHHLQAMATDAAGNQSTPVNIPAIIVVKPPGLQKAGLRE